MARKMMNDLFMGTQSTSVSSHACRVMIVTLKCEQALQTNCGTTVRVQMWDVRGVSVYQKSRKQINKKQFSYFVRFFCERWDLC